MRYVAALFLLLPVSCWAQSASTGQATSNGQCSVASSGSNNVIEIFCGTDAEQGKKLVALLNKILANQLDTKAVNQKLDELLKAKSVTQNCPNGICIGGDNSGNATVNNYDAEPTSRILTNEQGQSLVQALSVAKAPFWVIIGTTNHGQDGHVEENLDEQGVLAWQLEGVLIHAGWESILATKCKDNLGLLAAKRAQGIDGSAGNTPKLALHSRMVLRTCHCLAGFARFQTTRHRSMEFLSSRH